MCSVMLCKFNAGGSFFPEFYMAIYTPSDQEVLVLGYSNLCHCVPVHKAPLIHLRTWQGSEVSLLMLKYLQRPQTAK